MQLLVQFHYFTLNSYFFFCFWFFKKKGKKWHKWRVNYFFDFYSMFKTRAAKSPFSFCMLRVVFIWCGFNHATRAA